MTLLQNLLEQLSGNKPMICIKTDIPEEICKIDDELKAIIIVKILYVFGFLEQEKIEINLWMKLWVLKKMIDKIISILSCIKNPNTYSIFTMIDGF